jgi:RimJ/RimL family protein N-acetyltransferase
MEITLSHKRIALESRRIRLREIHDENLATIFHWRNTEKFRFLFHYDESIVTYDEFTKEFNRDAEVRAFQFLIEKKDTHEPIGLTFIHTYSTEYRSCFLNIFVSEPFEKKGYGTDAFVLFVLFLFNELYLNKLFVQASDYNEHSISCIRKIGMKELNGNITKKIHEGREQNIICFAADANILPRLIRINEFLSKPAYIF